MVSFKRETREVVSLHVGDEEEKYDTAERLKMIHEGLRSLAERLREAPTLYDVDEIVVVSWLVREHTGVFEHLGFTVDKEHHDAFGEEMVTAYMKEDYELSLKVPDEQRYTRPMYAKMSKQDFLQRYGS